MRQTNRGSGCVRSALGTFSLLLAWTISAPEAAATPYTACGGPGRICVAPVPGPAIPPAPAVPGKEHSTALDRHTGNAPPAPGPGCPPNPGQDVAWDGLGGTENSFDYEPADAHQTDAMANLNDALFFDVVADTAALVFSVDADPGLTVEPIAAAGGAGAAGGWAGSPAIEGMCTAADIDGVELWGADPQPGSDDANRFSRTGDPFDPGLPPMGGRTSIHAHPGAVPLCATAALAAGMAPLLGATPTQEADLAANMDVDALMLGDELPPQFDDDPPPPGFPPLAIMWSVRPIMVPADVPGGNPAPITLDGGEIFVGDCMGSPASYLVHGGHTWDTVFPVAATFGLPSENVNAIEGVAEPEPAEPVPSLRPVALGILLGCLAVGALLTGARRRLA